MPKLRPTDEELDVQELEEAEYEEGQFQSYAGEVPKTGTILRARVTKMWWSYTQKDDPMIKALAVAEDNSGRLEEFDGLPVWENLTLTPGGKFRWAPFFETFGFNIRDVKSKMAVAAEDDNLGAPIERIGSFEPGSDDAICMVVIKKERYNGEWQAKAQDWLLPEDEDEEEEEEEKPSPRASRSKPGTRTKADGRKPTTRSRRAEPEPDEDEDEPEDEEEESPPPARSSRSSRSSSARSSKTSGRRSASAGAKAGRGARRSKEEDDEPPF